MLQNNNLAIVHNIAKKYYKANKKRNNILIAAIVLATLLITSVCSVYYHYLKTAKYQELRETGTMVNAILLNPTDEQIVALHEMDSVQPQLSTFYRVGKLVGNVGQAGLIVDLSATTNWDKYSKPLVQDFEGHYPLESNEIMMSTWLLNRLKIQNPHIGMEIPLSIAINQTDGIANAQTHTFILSGLYTDTALISTGEKCKVYVSETLAKEHGIIPDGIGFLLKNTKNSNEQLDTIGNELKLTDNQRISSINDGNLNMKWKDFLAAIAVILFFMLDGSLIIYNVNYISITKDVQFYGMLKTLGMTPHQIRKMIYSNMLRTMIISIPIGLLLGGGVSYIVVPLALSGMTGGISAIELNGWIFLIASVFATTMIMISYITPARKAGKISPISATKYIDAQIPKKKKEKKTKSGGKIFVMALKNTFRNTKRAMIVILTLFLGGTTFLICTTVIKGMTVEAFIDNNIKNDIDLYNRMTRASFSPKEEQLFTPELMQQFKNINGVNSINTITNVTIYQHYNDKQYSKWLKIKNDFSKSLDLKPVDPQTYVNNPQAQFWGLLIGVDTKVIEEYNKTANQPIDVEAFINGDIILTTDMNGNGIDIGENIPFTVIDNEETFQMKVGGQIEFKRDGMNGGAAPWLIISNQAIKQIVPDPIIYSVKINAEPGYEQSVLNDVIMLTKDNFSISRTSKIEKAQSLNEIKKTLLYLATFITIVLSTIGILNFINTMTVSIVSRKNEFALMEAVGATKKQIRRLVTWEGVWYTIITSVLILTIGSVMNYLVFNSISNNMGFGVFSYPFDSFIIYTTIAFICCMMIPRILYKTYSKQSVVERLRETE